MLSLYDFGPATLLVISAKTGLIYNKLTLLEQSSNRYLGPSVLKTADGSMDTSILMDRGNWPAFRPALSVPFPLLFYSLKNSNQIM